MGSTSRRRIMKCSVCIGIIVMALAVFYPRVRMMWINRQLVSAVQEGNTGKIRALLLNGADANTRIHSTQFSLAEFAPWLRKPKQPSDSGTPTVLQYVLNENTLDFASADVLIRHGADVTVTDTRHRTFLDQMFVQGHGDEDELYTTIDLLLSHGCSSHTTMGDLLGISVEWHSAKLAEIALRYDRRSNRKDELDAAIGYGELDIVRLLLKSGIDPNSPDSFHQLPLIYASTVVYDQPEISAHGEQIRRGIVTALIESGARLDVTDNRGRTALYYALQRRDSILVSLLETHNNR